MIKLSQLDNYLCAPETTVRKAMMRINDTPPHEFVLVVDADRRLVGSLTDGDIRRAILRGVGLDDPVASCMQRDVRTGRRGAERDNLALMASYRVLFLPVVDDCGRVIEVLTGAKRISGPSAALVMAGGEGRRLGARTRSTPKPLLPVGGRPILEHVLSALETADVRTIYVSVHYLAEQIRDFLAHRASTADIRIIEEREPLGTAGAIGMITVPIEEPMLVVNGDVITRVDLKGLDAFHLRHGYEATVGVARYDVQIPFGVVHQNEEGLLTGIEEKPRQAYFVAAGIYYLSPEFCALVAKGQSLDMPELLNLGRTLGLRVGLFPIHEYWSDVGRPDDLEAAETAFRNGL